MEIPEYLKVLLFALVSAFIVYAIEPPGINVISAPLSNFTNIVRSVPYTVQQADNITKLVYIYNGVTNMSKLTGIDKNMIVKQLMSSRVFIINCSGIEEKNFGDPYNSSLICTFFGEKFWFKQ